MLRTLASLVSDCNTSVVLQRVCRAPVSMRSGTPRTRAGQRTPLGASGSRAVCSPPSTRKNRIKTEEHHLEKSAARNPVFSRSLGAAHWVRFCRLTQVFSCNPQHQLVFGLIRPQRSPGQQQSSPWGKEALHRGGLSSEVQPVIRGTGRLDRERSFARS